MLVVSPPIPCFCLFLVVFWLVFGFCFFYVYVYCGFFFYGQVKFTTAALAEAVLFLRTLLFSHIHFVIVF